MFGQNSARPLSLCSGRVFGRDYVRTKFCSAAVTLLGQSVRTGFCSDRILLGHCHSARAECSNGILFGHNSALSLSLCSGRVFGRDYVRTEFYSAVVTLLGQSVRKRFCSARILLGCCHSARAECSEGLLFGQNSARPLSLCSGRVFGHDSVRPEFYSATVTLLGPSVRKGFYSDRILLRRCHSARAECSDTILFRQNFVRPWSLCWGRVLGRDSAQIEFCLATVTLFGQSVRTRSCLDRILFGHYLGSLHVSPSPLIKNALGDVKDQADDKANPKPWYTVDEKSGKMSIEDLQDLIREYSLPEGWYARLPGLQEPANYGTKFETGIYEEQVKSGYRLPLHPFALRFFEHYRMAPGQLVPNGWRKIAGLIYLVQTSGYKPDATDFMRVFFEICFVKGVANCPGWYYIHSRQRLLKESPKSNKGWHSKYFFVGRLDKGELPFDRDWNPFCKDFENPGKPTPNNLTKHILSHIKLRGALCIDVPLSEEQLEWAKIIPPKPIPAGLLILSPSPAIPSMSSTETVPLVFITVLISTLIAEMASESGKSPKGGFLGVLQKAKGKRKEKQPNAVLSPVPKRSRVIPPECSPRILEHVSIDDDPIFRPRWTLRRDDLGMLDSQMYASRSEILSRFEMARQVATEEAQQKRDAIKEAQEATHRAEELSKQEADHLAQIATLEKSLERVKRKAAEEVERQLIYAQTPKDIGLGVCALQIR
ncbi:hypothetical protein RJ639_025881 [Escallonia herrerae]|uniref:Transposase (putative) gypsy type domain-containing protein n=1 Tax=Escallonia herrerae TaxID=1293975 RepID=A0AA88S6R0_9ASTE|nr:hypothetical protein RJ639_025881 [Escallonia herrerae]